MARNEEKPKLHRTTTIWKVIQNPSHTQNVVPFCLHPLGHRVTRPNLLPRRSCCMCQTFKTFILYPKNTRASEWRRPAVLTGRQSHSLGDGCLEGRRGRRPLRARSQKTKKILYYNLSLNILPTAESTGATIRALLISMEIPLLLRLSGNNL